MKHLPLRTEAIVLRNIDYGESDRIVTFFTEDYGKLKGFAKSARKSTRRFGNALELFVHLDVMFSRRKTEGLVFIENCDVKDHYSAIRDDLAKTLTASYITELTDRFTVEEKGIASLFNLLVGFLKLIETHQPSELLTRLFELKLLKHAGYEPEIEYCVACHRPIDRIETPLFSPMEGGIVCENCANPSSEEITLSHGTLKMLALGKTIDLDKVHRLVPSDKTLRESREMMGRFIRYLLGKELRSLAVLNQIRQLTPL